MNRIQPRLRASDRGRLVVGALIAICLVAPARDATSKPTPVPNRPSVSPSRLPLSLPSITGARQPLKKSVARIPPEPGGNASAAAASASCGRNVVRTTQANASPTEACPPS